MEWYIILGYVWLVITILILVSICIWGTTVTFKDVTSSKLLKFGYILADFITICFVIFMGSFCAQPHFGRNATFKDVENGEAHIVLDTVVIKNYVWNDIE